MDEIFDAPGPQIAADIRASREPTLRQILFHYYSSSGNGELSRQLTDEYVKHWNAARTEGG